jgi:hypothetical protein
VSAVQGMNSHSYIVTNSKTYVESLGYGHKQNIAKCKCYTGNLERIIIICYSKNPQHKADYKRSSYSRSDNQQSIIWITYSYVQSSQSSR